MSILTSLLPDKVVITANLPPELGPDEPIDTKKHTPSTEQWDHFADALVKEEFTVGSRIGVAILLTGMKQDGALDRLQTFLNEYNADKSEERWEHGFQAQVAERLVRPDPHPRVMRPPSGDHSRGG